MLTKDQIENFEGAGLIFMTKEMDILLLKDVTSGKWGMCKGHRDPDEDHYLDTAMREAREELGLDADDYEISSAPFVFEGSPKTYIFHYAILHKSIEDLIPQESEISDIKLVPIDELLDQDGNRENNIYVRLMIAHARGTYKKPKPKPIIIKPKPVIAASSGGWIPSYMREKSFVPIISEIPEVVEPEMSSILTGLTINTAITARYSPLLLAGTSPRTSSPRTLPSPSCAASILRPPSRTSPYPTGRSH